METNKLKAGLTPEEHLYLDALVRYRSSMADGRAKPDRNGVHAFVRDSWEYVKRIQDIDRVIDTMLDLDNKINILDDERKREISEMGYRFSED